MSVSLLATKLFIPPARNNLVPRPHLIERLDVGLECKLVLVSAPAGRGKTMLHLAIVTVLITASAPLLFDAPLPVNWLHYGLVFLAMAFACAGLSVLIGVISPSTRMTILWSQLIFIPSMLLGGLMLPYSMLPDVAGKVSQLLPATQAMNAFSGLAMGKTADFAPWGSVVALALSGLLAFLLAIYLFRWDSHNATRRGHSLMALLAFVPFAVGVFLF